MSTGGAPAGAVGCLAVTEEEAYLLLLALQNVEVDLGDHERALCGKVRDLWDGFRRSPAPAGTATGEPPGGAGPRGGPRAILACFQSACRAAP